MQLAQPAMQASRGAILIKVHHHHKQQPQQQLASKKILSKYLVSFVSSTDYLPTILFSTTPFILK